METEDERAGLVFSNESKRLDGEAGSARSKLTSPTHNDDHSRAPPPPTTFLRTNLSPLGCRSPLLPSCFRCCRRRRRRFDATRAGAAAAAAEAQARPSVRPLGLRASHVSLYHSPFPTHPFSPLFPFLPFPLPSFHSCLPHRRPSLPVGAYGREAVTGREGKQMATAGGAKMEPASCVKQSPSQNALRCLRFVPPWERHSAERGGVAGQART